MQSLKMTKLELIFEAVLRLHIHTIEVELTMMLVISAYLLVEYIVSFISMNLVND